MKVRLRFIVLVMVASTATACAPASNTVDSPWCDEFGVLILEAQSVPSAQLLPCVELMPLGWSVGSSHIDSEGTSFTLRSAVAGTDAARVLFTDVCNTEGYVRVPSDEEDTERYELVSRLSNGYRGVRVYLFDGGCVAIDFALDADVSASLLNDVSLALGFMSRAAVNEAVREVTDGREQLDPLPAG